jgi:hypothetical protein
VIRSSAVHTLTSLIFPLLPAFGNSEYIDVVDLPTTACIDEVPLQLRLVFEFGGKSGHKNSK